MAIVKGPAKIIDSSGVVIGEGMAYVHLPLGRDARQRATGTMSMRRWEPGEGRPDRLLLEDGTALPISVTRQGLSDCSQHRILRYSLEWQPSESGER